MAKSIPDAVLDAQLALLTDCDRIALCSAQPTTYTEATSTHMLALATISGSDFAAAEADTSGRKVHFLGKTSVATSVAGTAAYVALCKSGDSSLKAVTTGSVTVTFPGTVDIPAFYLKNPEPV
jgi:hypothetical protein